MKEIGRLLTAMVTPFDENGNVYYEQAKKLALALINSGSDGVVVSGTTGESPTLSKEEKLRLFVEVKSAIGNKGIVIAGTSSYNTAESIEITKEAEKTGVDAFLLVVPSYNRPPQEGLYEHFKAIAKSTDLPCILYNVPSRTKTNMEAATTIKLSKIDNIIGIKEASGDMKQVAKIISSTKPDFLVYSGNDSDTLLILTLGGYGVISVASHLVGKQIKAMIYNFLSGEVEKAAEIHRHLLLLVDALFLVSNPIPIKYALNWINFRVGEPRLPLIDLDCQSDKKIPVQVRWVISEYKIDLPIPKGGD